MIDVDVIKNEFNLQELLQSICPYPSVHFNGDESCQVIWTQLFSS